MVIVIAMYVFQFHKGTIKACKQRPCLYVAHLFQFHKGTIKAAGTFFFFYVLYPLSIP